MLKFNLSDFDYLLLDLLRFRPKRPGFFYEASHLRCLERMETLGLIAFDGERWQIEARGLYALEHELDEPGT